MAYVLKPKRGKKSTLERINPVLMNGEICFEVPDTGVGTGSGKIKMGDGITPYNELPYFSDADISQNVIEFEEIEDKEYEDILRDDIQTGNTLAKIIGSIKRFIRKITESIGQPNGIVPLNEDGFIDTSYLPASIDDILEFDGVEHFPEVGEKGKIYVDISSGQNTCYRWSGSTYVLIANTILYNITKSGSTIYLNGSDGSQSSVSGIGVEILDHDPENPTPGAMWYIKNS